TVPAPTVRITMTPLDRRGFLAALPALAWADAKPDLPIVDTHLHLWDLKKFRLPWITKDSPLARNYLLDDSARATAGLGMVQAVYMEVDVDPAQQQAEADYVVSVCKKGDTVMKAATISGRPAAEGFAKYVGQFKGSPFVKGLRQVLHGQQTKAGFCLEKAFIRGIRLLGEVGLRYDLCMRHAELPDATKLLDACPDTKFVLDHCGNPPLSAPARWKKDITELAKRKNVVAKVSGIVAQAKPGWKAEDLAPVVRHTLKVF